MIQRIQSLYLLAIAALMATAVFTPLAYFVAGVEEFELYAFALKNENSSHSTVYMGIIVALAAILPFVTIFCLKIVCCRFVCALLSWYYCSAR